MYTQVDDSGHRIPLDPAEKMQESHRILQENTGNRWNMEAVFRPEIVQIFSGSFRTGLFDLGMLYLFIPILFRITHRICAKQH